MIMQVFYIIRLNGRKDESHFNRAAYRSACMYFLIAGSVLFFSAHLFASFRNHETQRDIRKRISAGRYMGIFSLVSALGLALIIWGFALSRPSPMLYQPPVWGPHFAMALMLPSLILLVAAHAPRGYIKQALGHPMLYGIMLWSLAHLAVNAELNALIVFGSFLAYALIDRIAVIGRNTTVKRASIFGDIFAIVIGTLLYGVIIQYFHSMLIGVPIYASP